MGRSSSISLYFHLQINIKHWMLNWIDRIKHGKFGYFLVKV